MVLYHSILREFGTCSCKPTPWSLLPSLLKPGGTLTPDNKRFILTGKRADLIQVMNFSL